MGRILDRHTARGRERAGSRWVAPAGRAGTARWMRALVDSARPPAPGSTLAAPESCRAQAVSTCVAVGFRAHRGGPPERNPTSMRAVIVRRRLVVQAPLEAMCGSCGAQAVSSSGPSSQYSWAWRSARCSGAPARQSFTLLSAGNTRTGLRPLHDTGPCDRRRVLDSPGPSASSGLPTVSAAVRGAPAASPGRWAGHTPGGGPTP